MVGRLVTLVRKDVTLFFKNRFFALITILSLAGMMVAYFLVPKDVDETIELGIVGEAFPHEFAGEGGADEGLVFVRYDYQDAMEMDVLEGKIEAGLVVPDDLTATMSAGERPRIELIYDARLPQEMADLLPLVVEEIFFSMAGQPLDIETRGEVLGPDLIGRPISPRDRMLPMLTVFVLMVETLGLAGLITSEIEWGTIRALLVTPTRIVDLFASKLATGFMLAFGQGVLILLVTGGLLVNPAIMLLSIALGSLLVTSVAFLLSSISKDTLSVTGWGALAIIILALPSINLVLPGLTSDWVQAIPTYYLVDTLHRVLNFQADWPDVGGNLLILAGSTVVLLGLGMFSLRRRFS